MSENNHSTSLSPVYTPSALHASPLEHETLQKLFHKMSATEYTSMWLLYRYAQDTGSQKIYLKEIAQRLSLPMAEVSKLAGDLKSKGFVHWTHDGTGEDGTYIQFTDTFLKSAQEQKQRLSNYYRRVIEAYGEDQFIQLLGELAKLEDIMRLEAEKAGEINEHAGS